MSLPKQSLAEAARLVHKGVIGLASALACHGLTDQMAPQVWIAIGRKDWRPRISYPPIRIARFPDELLRRSVELKTIAGTPVPVFGVAKTVADLFRYRLTVGDALAIEGLRQALRQRQATPAEIAREAEAAGVWATMKPYLMAFFQIRSASFAIQSSWKSCCGRQLEIAPVSPGFADVTRDGFVSAAEALVCG